MAGPSEEKEAARNTLTPTLSRKRARGTSCSLALGQDFLRGYVAMPWPLHSSTLLSTGGLTIFSGRGPSEAGKMKLFQ